MLNSSWRGHDYGGGEGDGMPQDRDGGVIPVPTDRCPCREIKVLPKVRAAVRYPFVLQSEKNILFTERYPLYNCLQDNIIV